LCRKVRWSLHSTHEKRFKITEDTMQERFGVIYILSVLPVWATVAILLAVTQFAIIVGRDFLEGIPYQVSYSAAIGDTGFVIVVLIAALILQSRAVYIPPWLCNRTVHVVIFAASVLLGITVSVLTLHSRSGQWMDIYHDVTSAPLFLNFAIILLPVIYYNGTRVEKLAVFGFITLWLVFVAFDIKYDRMNQRRWLHDNIDFIEQMK
jgi:hypothetical protein